MQPRFRVKMMMKKRTMRRMTMKMTTHMKMKMALRKPQMTRSKRIR